jgi:hypothetical protein
LTRSNPWLAWVNTTSDRAISGNGIGSAVEIVYPPTMEASMKMMSEDQIPNFVQEVADTGCNITAVLGVGYIIGDSDLSGADYDDAAAHLKEITARYGERDHLLSEIAEHLVSIGRYYPKKEEWASAGVH